MSDAKVIHRELECVSRQECDRNCRACDLVMEASDIIRALEHAIRLLDAEASGRLVEIPEGDYTFLLKRGG